MLHLPDTIYPKSAAEWGALIAALSPIVIWSITGLVRGIALLGARKEASWRRLQELALILYNKAGSHGGLAQVLAAKELKSMWLLSAEAKSISKSSYDHFSSNGPNSPELIAALEWAADKKS